MLNRGSRVLLWRWRHNPLKRRTDVAEAWIGMAAAVTFLLTAPMVGVATAAVAERSALDQALGLHRVTARLIEDAPAAASRFSEMAAEDRATVRWTTASGTVRSGTAPVAAGSKAGSHTTVWLDGTGRIRPAPPTPDQASVQGAVLGTAAAVGTGLLVLGARWATRVRLDRRRWAQWDRAWAEFDAPRGHRHA